MLQRIVWRGCAGLLLAVSLMGCRLPVRNQLEQCRNESEQLLSEYRQQRDRAERLELENRTLNEQIASVEKKLALASKGGEERLAALPDAPAKESNEQRALPSRPEGKPREEEQSPPEDGWRGIPRS